MKNTMEYFREARKELGKVHWPDKPKVIETSLVVAGCTLVFAGYLYLVDIGISKLFSIIFYR